MPPTTMEISNHTYNHMVSTHSLLLLFKKKNNIIFDLKCGLREVDVILMELFLLVAKTKFKS